MEKLTSSNAMRVIDQKAQKDFGFPESILMESAGIRLFQELEPNLDISDRILFLAGPGNNGGDALVLARQALQFGYPNIDILLLQGKESPLRAKNRIILENLGVTFLSFSELYESPPTADLIIDGLFGLGLSRPLEGESAKIAQWASTLQGKRVAIDVPSGLWEGYQKGDPILPADLTLTIGLLKEFFLRPLCRGLVGEIRKVPIGFPQKLLLESPALGYFVPATKAVRFPGHWQKDDYKSKKGHVLVIGGLEGTPGAPLMAAEGASSGGCGLVSLLRNTKALPVQLPSPSYLMHPSLSELVDREKPPSTLVLGPGGWSPEEDFLQYLSQNSSMMSHLVLDAGSLDHLQELLPHWKGARENCVLTPHPGELVRMGFNQDDLSRDPLGTLGPWVDELGVALVYKTSDPWIFTPGDKPVIMEGRNPRMAIGGSGDVLAGLIAGVLASSNSSTQEALIYALRVHQEAGRRLATIFSPADLIHEIRRIIGEDVLG